MSDRHSSRVLVALGTTGAAVGACMLAHKLWLRHQDAGSLQVWSSSTWLPQLLLQSSTAMATAQADYKQQPVLYDWAQSIEEVLVEARLPAHIQQHEVHVKFCPSALLVVVGQQRVIDGCLTGPIVPQHCSWKIEGHGRSRKLSITLVKQPAAAAGQQQQQYTVWEGLLAGPAGDDAPKSPEKRDQAAKEG